MLITDKGLIAQGESEYCGTIDGGLDCGKYILTYHKLFDGLINNCTAYDNGQCSTCQNVKTKTIYQQAGRTKHCQQVVTLQMEAELAQNVQMSTFY